MDEDEARRMIALLSPERMAPYLNRCAGNSVAAIRLYYWNIDVTRALQAHLPFFEPILRNSMAAQLATLTGRVDWWHAGALPLRKPEAARLDRALQACGPRQPSLRVGDVLTELSLGFWAALLGREYEMTLWRPALRHAFPEYRGARGPLHRDLHHLNRLRNRMAHHEPIHHRHLAADNEKIFLIMGYVSSFAATSVRANDRVPEELARKPKL
ncbi:hypothetical protein [Micromonospora chokoriensis]|uniref:Abi-like protein n=1 Tax=Micromonospora chokoriensis TaxID=356851 RepID=A0A1C4UDG6_9ACTN|nr:hypothetical protein [Micromonospora chokoriensis]SCE69716.1 hypothetical protein GA0070612_0317 [Micromonospora chokoriensis]